jgi:carotenoid cleavage dioxygenase
MSAVESPLLTGTYGPIHEESVFEDLAVIGELPQDLNGAYFRNGPNARHVPAGRYHWFDGDGMLHGIYFDRGRVAYRNRWVRTRCFGEEQSAGRALWPGIMDPPRRDRPDMPLKDTSNTDVKFHAGRLVTMWYLAGQPYHVDPWTLETIGPADFKGTLRTRVSAHSKVDEQTGEFIYFDYGKEWPYMSWGIAGPDGMVTHAANVELPGPSLPHDMAFTRRHVVLHDLSLTYDPEAFAAGRHKLRFFGERPARFAVIPRNGGERDVRWFDAEPCFIYHVVNAWDDGDEVVMIACRYRTPRHPDGTPDEQRYAKAIAHLQIDASLYEWRFDLRTGATRERLIDDTLNTEFPTMNSALQGVPTRHAYHVLMRNRPLGAQFGGLVKYDCRDGRFTAYSGGEHLWYSESPFAPSDAHAAEDDGYLVSLVTDMNAGTTEVQVFDARGTGVGDGPVARIPLPRRVPHGFHGTWVSARRLGRPD